MFDYEGSRGEFLKILAEMGEEPAFIARARAPVLALDALLKQCELHRADLLIWPRRHFTALRQRIGDDWNRLASLVVNGDASAMFTELAAQLPRLDDYRGTLFARDKRLLRQFLGSASRFNTSWNQYIENADLGEVNQLRSDYNQYYLMEKSCAFGSEMSAGTFSKLKPLNLGFLLTRFPILSVPSLA